jgi:hypothetical protein
MLVDVTAVSLYTGHGHFEGVYILGYVMLGHVAGLYYGVTSPFIFSVNKILLEPET